jgi:hypothetical protein
MILLPDNFSNFTNPARKPSTTLCHTNWSPSTRLRTGFSGMEASDTLGINIA